VSVDEKRIMRRKPLHERLVKSGADPVAPVLRSDPKAAPELPRVIETGVLPELRVADCPGPGEFRQPASPAADRIARPVLELAISDGARVLGIDGVGDVVVRRVIVVRERTDGERHEGTRLRPSQFTALAVRKESGAPRAGFESRP